MIPVTSASPGTSEPGHFQFHTGSNQNRGPYDSLGDFSSNQGTTANTTTPDTQRESKREPRASPCWALRRKPNRGHIKKKTMHQRRAKFEPLNKLVATFLRQGGQQTNNEIPRVPSLAIPAELLRHFFTRFCMGKCDYAGREEETDNEAVASDTVVAAQPVEHGKEQRRRTWTENGREEGEAEERHITATYHDLEQQEGAVQELTSATAEDHAAYHRTRHRGRRPIDLRHDTELEGRQGKKK